MLLRRLSLSHANKPRKRYEGYANAKKDAGRGHWTSGIDGAVRREALAGGSIYYREGRG